MSSKVVDSNILVNGKSNGLLERRFIAAKQIFLIDLSLFINIIYSKLTHQNKYA